MIRSIAITICSKKYWQSIVLLTQISIIKRDGNTLLGGLWGLIQPFLQIIIIAYFMGFLLRYPTKTIATNLVSVLPFWTFMMSGIEQSANSLYIRSEILKRAVLPKTYFPISDVLSIGHNLIYSFIAMYFALTLLYPEFLSWKIIFIPFLALPLVITVTTISIVVSFATPYLRDIPRLINVMFSIIYWTIPIIYPYALVPESKRIFFELNPVFALLRPMQELVLTSQIPTIIVIIKSWIVTILVVLVSVLIYKKLTRNVIYYL